MLCLLPFMAQERSLHFSPSNIYYSKWTFSRSHWTPKRAYMHIRLSTLFEGGFILTHHNINFFSIICIYYNSISLISMIVWTASARHYNPISLTSMMMWTASARYYNPMSLISVVVWVASRYYNPMSLISVMVWTASAGYYNPMSLISVMVWTALVRYRLIVLLIPPPPFCCLYLKYIACRFHLNTNSLFFIGFTVKTYTLAT